MIIQTWVLKDLQDKPASITIELTPENDKEEKILRDSKILHKCGIMVYWGDTIELEHRGKFLCYDGLKINIKIPKGE